MNENKNGQVLRILNFQRSKVRRPINTLRRFSHLFRKQNLHKSFQQRGEKGKNDNNSRLIFKSYVLRASY